MRVPRGTKTETRWYKAELVEAARARRAEREASTPAPDIDHVGNRIAADRLLEYADTAPFFFGVPPESTERVRERIRAIARRLAR